jgi:hypothetical protein
MTTREAFAQAEASVRYQLALSFPGVSAVMSTTVNKLTDKFYLLSGQYVIIRVVTPPSDGGNIGVSQITGATNGQDNSNRYQASPQANTTYTLGPFNTGWYAAYSWNGSTYRPSLTGEGTIHIFLPENTAIVFAQAQAKIVTQWRFAQVQANTWVIGGVNEVYNIAQSGALIKVVGSYPWYVHRHGSNLLAYYRLGDIGTTVYDSSIYQNHATLANGVGSASSGAIYGDSDYSVSFDGATQRAVTASTVFPYANNVTIEAWVYPTAASYSAANRDFIWGASGVSSGFHLELGGSAGTNRVAVSVPGTWLAQTNDNAITLNQWNHIVYTRSGTGTTHKIYVNGVSVPLVTNHNTATQPDNAAVKVIGAYSAASYFFQGKIDEVAVYKVALTPAEVLEHYTLGIMGGWQQYAQAGAEIAGVYASHSFARVLYSVTNTPVHVSKSFIRVVYKVKDPQWAQAQAFITPEQPYRNAVVADNPYGYWPLSDSDQKVRAYVGPQGYSYGSAYNVVGGWTRAVNVPMPAYDRAQGISNNNTVATINTFTSQVTNNFTVEAWVKPGKNIGSGGVLPTEATSGTYAGYNANAMSFVFYPIQMGSNRGLGLSVGFNGIVVAAHGNSTLCAILSYSATLSGWHHIAVVVTNKQPVLYLDGVAVRTGLTVPESLLYSPYTMGDSGSNYGYLTGSVSNAALYNTSLTGTQILNHYLAGVPGVFAQAMAHIGKQAGYAQAEALIDSDLTLVSQSAQAEAQIILINISQVAQAAARLARYTVSANAMALNIVEDSYYQTIIADSPLAYYRLDESNLSFTNLVRFPIGGTATYTMRTVGGSGAADGDYGTSAAEPANTSNYWKVEWSQPQSLDTIAMLDRSDGGGGYSADYWGSGSFTIDFSDGSQVTVQGIPNGWGPTVAKFIRKDNITWFKVNAPPTQAGYSPGFQEIEAFLGAPEIKSYGGTQDYNAYVAAAFVAPSSTQGLVDQSNTALSFAGTTALVVGATSSSIPYSNISTGSVEAWVQTASSSGTQAIVVKSTEWGLFINNGNISFYDYDNATMRQGPSISDDLRHHLVLTWSGTTGKLYVDGSLKLTATMVRNDSNFSTVAIGSSGFNTSQAFSGVIDEVAIYNTQLTDEQIRWHYSVVTGIQLAQAQTYILRNPAFAQAQASIQGNITFVFAQAEAYLSSPLAIISQSAQVQAQIILFQYAFGQAAALLARFNVCSQAQAAVIPQDGFLAYLFFQGSGYDHEVGTIENIWGISTPNMIKYDDGSNKPPGTGTRTSYFGVTAIGRFVADETGAWYFHLQSDDASRISIYNSANEIVGTVGAWPGGSAGGSWTGTINLTQGQEYKIIWQWSEGGGEAYVTYNHFRRPSEVNESWLTDSNPAPWMLVGTRYRWANAMAFITRRQCHAQAQADIWTTYNKFAQAQTRMVKDRISAIAQGMAFIFSPKHALAQARVKQVYQKYAQAQVSVTKYSKLMGHGLANALIKGKPWKNAYVMAFINDRKPHANANAYIKRGEFALANAQGKTIKPWKKIGYAQAAIHVYDQNAFALAMTTINQMQFTAQSVAKVIGYDYNRFGLAQAWILKGTQLAQAQARMYGEIYQVYAQSRAMIEKFTYNSGQARADILRQYRMYVQAQATIKYTNSLVFTTPIAFIKVKETYSKFGQAGALIGTLKTAQAQARIHDPRGYANAMAFVPMYKYVVKYNNYDLPGYAQNESYISSANLIEYSSPYKDGAPMENLGIRNKVISLRLKIVGNSHQELKQKAQMAATVLRSSRDNSYRKLYVGQLTNYYLVKPTKIQLETDVNKASKFVEYEVEFDTKPWLFGEQVFTLSGSTSINTGARSVTDGTWTPATVLLTGTNITVSGYTESGDFAGFISVSGTVSNLVINSESYTATINGVNKNNLMKNLDYAIYVGPGKTYFNITGATSTIISYRNRWDI